jgi:hypothetical protein
MLTKPRTSRRTLDWTPILAHAKAWVEAQELTPTLRQTFYHLVATGIIPNNDTAYKTLSSKTAQARRDRTFPSLLDNVRDIDRMSSWSGLDSFAEDAAHSFHLDRTEGQVWQVWVAVEKRGMVAQAAAIVGDRGWATVPLGGFGSQTIVDDVAAAVAADGRPAVLLLGGDFDASGWGIRRDFVARTGCWNEVIEFALTHDQVLTRGLMPTVGSGKNDSRNAGFMAAHGLALPVQVEVDVLTPTEFKGLLLGAGDPFWDESVWDSVVAEEERLRAELMSRLAA